MKGGAIEYLTKPFRDQDLLDGGRVLFMLKLAVSLRQCKIHGA
jgi:FixJ family two-component response regulator